MHRQPEEDAAKRPKVVSNWWYAVGFFFVGVPSVFVFWLIIYPFFIRLFY